jgi:hypothetical protein
MKNRNLLNFYLLFIFSINILNPTAFAAVGFFVNETDEITILLEQRKKLLEENSSTKEVDMKLAKHGHYFTVVAKQSLKENSRLLNFELLRKFDARSSQIFSNRIKPVFPWLLQLEIEPDTYNCTIEIADGVNEEEIKNLFIHFHYSGYTL